MSAAMKYKHLCIFLTRQRFIQRHPIIVYKRECSASNLVVNHNVYLDPRVKKALDDQSIQNPKKHPGRLDVKAVYLPPKLSSAAERLIEKYPSPNLKKKAREMYKHLWSRKLKMPDDVITKMSHLLKAKYLQLENVNMSELSPEEKEGIEQKINRKVIKELRRNIYHWKPINFRAQQSFHYMNARLPADYSCLIRVFYEMANRDKTFVPKTMLDFGSGLCSAVWAANTTWQRSILEHMCVDVSADMNTLARLLLQGGEEDGNMAFNGVYFKQYLSAEQDHQYDLVVSAFSLIELGTKEERLKTLLTLWKCTEKYLVIIENGTNAGFHLVCEARDFLLQVGEEGSDPELVGHVFAPCPHDMMCPRAVRNDRTPCNFEVTHHDHLNFKETKNAENSRFWFSYVVLQKGERDISVPAWPRLVRPPNRHSKMVNCQLCSTSGELENSVITAKKHGKQLYRCARSCTWGDLLPVLNKRTEDSESPAGNVEKKSYFSNKKVKSQGQTYMQDQEEADIQSQAQINMQGQGQNDIQGQGQNDMQSQVQVNIQGQNDMQGQGQIKGEDAILTDKGLVINNEIEDKQNRMEETQSAQENLKVAFFSKEQSDLSSDNLACNGEESSAFQPKSSDDQDRSNSGTEKEAKPESSDTNRGSFIPI